MDLFNIRRLLWEFIISVTFIFGVICQTAKGQLLNVAVNKTTEQSTGPAPYHGTSPLAVDGVANQDYTSGFCSSTGMVVRPYWKVDLGAVYDIYYIKIFGRTDCCPARFSNMNIHTSSNNGVYNTFSIHSGQQSSIFESRPRYPKSVRWVQISKWGNEGTYLTLCEVQVMTRDVNERERLRMKSIVSVKGDGRTIQTLTRPSLLRCAWECFLDQSCFSMNVIQTTSSQPDVECTLLNSASYGSTAESNVKYYEIY